MLIALIGLAMWLMIAPPALLLPTKITIPAQPATAHALAVVLVGRAQEVVAFYRDHGGLPATLAGLDSLPEEIQYRTIGPAAFELRARLRDSTLVLPVTIPRTGAPSYDLKLTGFTP
jgi:hypothetical protein